MKDPSRYDVALATVDVVDKFMVTPQDSER